MKRSVYTLMGVDYLMLAAVLLTSVTIMATAAGCADREGEWGKLVSAVEQAGEPQTTPGWHVIWLQNPEQVALFLTKLSPLASGAAKVTAYPQVIGGISTCQYIVWYP